MRILFWWLMGENFIFEIAVFLREEFLFVFAGRVMFCSRFVFKCGSGPRVKNKENSAQGIVSVRARAARVVFRPGQEGVFVMWNGF